MFNFRWSTIVCVISATVSLPAVLDAKDEHRRAEHKTEHKVEHKAPAAPAAPVQHQNPVQNHNPVQQHHNNVQAIQQAPVAVERRHQNVHQPKIELQQIAPKVDHRVQLLQSGGQNNAAPGERHRLHSPNDATIQLMQNKTRNEDRNKQPQHQPNQPPQNQPKLTLPNNATNNSNNNPGNNKRPQFNPNLPNNSIPGAGAGNALQGQGAGQIKTIQPQHGHRGGDTPQGGVGLQNPGNNKLPQFNPNLPNNNVNNTLPKIDNKHVIENRRDTNLPGLNNNLQPGAGNVGGLKSDTKQGDGPRHFGRDHLPLKNDTPISGIQKQATPLQIPKNGTFHVNPNPQGGAPGRHNEQLQALMQSKDHHDLQLKLQEFKHSPDFTKQVQMAHLNVDKISGLHQDRLAHGDVFKHWQNTNVGNQLQLERQFQLQRHGDLTRQMNFSTVVINNGGWQQRHHGAVAAAFTAGSFSVWYAGGGCYPTHCWYPRWSPWVSWCWWDTCVPFYDPRPIYCRPVVYQPCQPWVYYQYPVWQPLPIATCGTWVNVEPVVVQAGMDLQLLAVRFVDNGHPEQNLGPRYRVWVRNNSPIQITSPFSVLALASNDPNADASLPQAGVVIPSMDIGEVKPIDIRLPLQANRMGASPEGHKVPFNYLQVLVDSHQQIPEANKANNGAVLSRTDILPVDPASFSSDLTVASPGSTLTIAGEGFGPEPGRVLVSVNGQQTEAVIQGWYDLGVRFTVPSYNLTGVVDADVLVVRGDGAVSNPLDLDIGPASMVGQPADFPAAPTPDAP